MTDTSPERWREIEEWLDRVLDAPEAERDSILQELGASDPALRREVEGLLEASDRAGERFETPPLLFARDVLLQSVDVARDQIEAGDVIGAYRITRLLGRGGMGAVYEAERADGAFEKRVAIKVVKRGMDTDEIIRRFHHERWILARLEHPNIAGIIDGGITDDGLPYFVMELAAGDPIDDWCDRHTLLVRERLELFEQVCKAVQYAHGNLIIHRDLKPGNIVVTDDGVKLLDFGIAKLLGPEDSSQVTQLNETRLTPQYAAPEQVRGEVTTTATDVYSLGVLLYELLCGRPPYRLGRRSMVELQQIICNVEPTPPSQAVRPRDDGTATELARSRGLGRIETLQLQLRGDLDAICLKALRKAPEDRYVSAAALAEDIGRHLDGRAVRAHPPTRLYRLRKFVRRNRNAVLFGVTATSALLVALITATVLGRQAATERDLRQVEAERATAARDFIIGTLATFDPDERPGQQEFTAHEVIESGKGQLDALDVRPPLKASVMNTLAQVAFNLGERATADSLFQVAYDILVSSDGGLDLAVSMQGIGRVKQHDRKFDEAIEWFGRALDLRRQLDAGPAAIAESQNALAFAHYAAETAPHLAEAERLYDELMEWPDSMPSVRASALEGLADIALERKQFDRSDSLYAASLEVRARYQPPDHPDVARALMGVVATRRGQHRYAEAEAEARRLIEILDMTYGERPHRDFVFGYRFLGAALSDQKKYGDAAVAYRRAAEMSEIVNVPGHVDTMESWLRYAAARIAEGRVQDAEDALRQARTGYFDTIRSPADSVAVGDAIAQTDTLIARILVDTGRTAEAESLLVEAGRLAVDSALVKTVAARLARMPTETGGTDGRRD